MTLIDLQDNPVVAKLGTKLADSTIITSEIGGDPVTYQVEDRATGTTVTIASSDDITNYGNVVAVNTTRLKIILKERTKYKVRVKSSSVGWGSWLNFTTRDKRYQSPDAITKLSDNTDNTAGTTGSGVSNGGNRRIVVTNSAKASTVYTDRGADVTNSDTVYADTTSITSTDAGATILNDTTIVYTDRGANINNN